MFHASIPDFTAVAAIFFAAGAVKGVLGMGLPTIAMGLLGLVLPVAGAAALLAVPSLVTNLWQAAAGPGLREALRRHWALQAGIVAGVAAAALLFQGPSDAWGRRLLGACLLAYGVSGLWGLRLPAPAARWERWVGAGIGAATGVITGFTGVFVLPAVPYLQSLNLGKDGLAQALGISFSVSTLALAVVLAAQGHMHLDASLASLAMVIPAVLGMWLGQSVRAGLSEAIFRRVFFTGLALLGTWLLAR